MSDIREGRDGRMVDPYRETLSQLGSTLRPETPAGSELTLNPDGSATFDLGDSPAGATAEDHSANLAETLEQARLAVIATDLLDAIEIDKEARSKRDAQYEEGLRRTGLGNDAPGGAPFAGASRVVHPMLTEAIVDYSSRVVGELLPPDGPVKSQVFGEPTNDKTERGERTARYMNYQLTEAMPSVYSEMEQGFTQEGLGGAFYTKWVVNDGKPDVNVVYIDKVHRPWSDGDFYSQQRITHEMSTDKWEFESNVKSGLWLDVVDPATSSDTIEQSRPETSNDRIIGRDQPSQNVDAVRTVFEISTRMALEEDDDVLPYLVTIDEQSRRVLSIYRNWEEGDANKSRIDYLVEWPFWPWRGGYPIGLAHMIGSLSGAASGSLRALLDAALLATMQTGVKLKGGVTAGGQNIRPQVGSTTEMQGTLAMDDIRKTYMPLEFPPPSPVLFQLLGFLVDSGRGVIRTTFDEFNKMNGEMPVGTANMMIEQGLKSFGSVFSRQHRSMRRFLKQLWKINQQTVTNEQIVDQFGELLVTKEDFAGPMTVQPVSDPRIFSDTQRQAQGQLVASRAQMYAQSGPGSPYKVRAAELFMMKQMKVPQPEQFLTPDPQPQQLNAAAENVAASQGMPLKVFPGQDHEAHIAQHGAYMQSQLFGMNSIIALKFLPIMLNHFAEHMSLWYADAMLLATNAVLQETFKDERITVEALQTVKGLEAQLDRLMAELTPDVLQHADQVLAPALEIIGKAQALMKQLQPPTPMDPSVVAQQDVKRQETKDQADIGLKTEELKGKQQTDAQKAAADAKKHDDDTALATRQQEIDAENERQRLDAERERDSAAHQIAVGNLGVAGERNDVTREVAEGNNETKLETTEDDNKTALTIVEKEIAAGKHKGNIKNGKGIQK